MNEKLKEELKNICEKYDTKYSSIELLVEYYIKSLNWTEKEALEYALELFKNGTITKIEVIMEGKNEKRKIFKET